MPRSLSTWAAACVAAWAPCACPRAGAGERARPRPPRPAELASVFSFGYAGDRMPKDDGRFEELLRKIKAGGFNVVHCTWTPRRLALCRKHGVRMMVDLLAADVGHHVYKNVEGVRALCGTLRGDAAVWGYNTWNDNVGKTTAGRQRDLDNVRAWDPTHPAYCGTYRTYGMRRLTRVDVFGYYDYHWKRAPQYHFPHLLTYRAWAVQREACFYRWVWVESGIPGKGNLNRSLYTVNTSIACGLKGVLWFLGTRLLDARTLQWTTTGGDIVQVNRQVMPLRREIMRIGNPAAVYSTPVTKTANDRPLPDGKAGEMPPGLEKSGFPADFRLQPGGGEFVLGVFRDDRKRDAVFVANHNAYAAQDVVLKLARPARVSLFDRKRGEWQALPVEDNAIRFKLAPAGGELLRFER